MGFYIFYFIKEIYFLAIAVKHIMFFFAWFYWTKTNSFASWQRNLSVSHWPAKRVRVVWFDSLKRFRVLITNQSAMRVSHLTWASKWTNHSRFSCHTLCDLLLKSPKLIFPASGERWWCWWWHNLWQCVWHACITKGWSGGGEIERDIRGAERAGVMERQHAV